MSIRTKSLGVIALAAALSAWLIFAIARAAVLSGFTSVEQRQIADDLARARDVLHSQAEDFRQRLLAWRGVDARFSHLLAPDLKGPIPQRVLSAHEFTGATIALIVDKGRGAPICGVLSPAGEVHGPLPADVEQHLVRLAMTLGPSLTPDGLAGLTNLPTGHRYLVAIAPTARPDDGPAAIVLARRFDAVAAADLSARLRVNVELSALDPANAPHTASQQPAGTPIFPDDDPHTIRARTTLRDISGQPSVILEVSSDRPVHQQGVASIRLFTDAVLIAGLAVALMLGLTLHVMVIRPVRAIEAALRDQPDQRRPRLVAAAASTDEIGRLARSIIRLLDDLHRGQLELRRSERAFREMADASPVMVWVTDRHAAVTYANPPMRELMGPTTATHASPQWLDLVHPDDAEAARAIVQLAAIERRPFTIECRFVPSDSAPRWVRVSGRPRFDSGDTFQGFIGVCDDIHEERLAEQILRESEEKFRSMFESAPVAIALCDIAGTVLQANPRFCQLVGSQPDRTAGTALTDLVPDATARTFVELARDSLLPRRLEPRESRLAGPNHTSTPVLISGATVRTADGQTRLWVFAEDISARLEIETRLRQTATDLARAKAWLEAQAAELHQRTEELDAARRAAEAASQAKGQFLANMSHEIRTPMTAILGFADLLDDPDLSGELRRQHIRTIKSSGAHLLSILNDILDLSKIEAGRMTVERIDVSPLQIAREVAALLDPRAQSRGISLDLSTSPTLPETIPTDPIRLRQILINLLGNAIKFTQQGGVVLQLHADQNARTLRIDVVDTGIGMTPEQLSAVFSPFTQADPTMARRFGGTGLGLTICARLADILGYRLTATSTPGQGSTFSLHIPLDHNPVWINTSAADLRPQATHVDPPQHHHPTIAGRVLVAEDGRDNQRLIEHLLRRAGLDVTIVDDGQAAIDAIENAKRLAQPFDLIILDMQMPVLDGYTAATRLRAQGVPTPIIALTAHATTADRIKCIHAGCDDYLVKPIDRERLIATCANWIAKGRKVQPQPHAAA